MDITKEVTLLLMPFIPYLASQFIVIFYQLYCNYAYLGIMSVLESVVDVKITKDSRDDRAHYTHQYFNCHPIF